MPDALTSICPHDSFSATEVSLALCGLEVVCLHVSRISHGIGNVIRAVGQYGCPYGNGALIPGGAPIPGASVSVTNTETNQARTEVTCSGRNIRSPVLPVGTYKVVISASGFKTAEIDGIALNVTETRSVTQRLEIGTQTQQVTGSTEAATVQTETSEMGSVTNSQTISSIPLVTRNFTQILALNPGVIQDVANASSFGPFGFQDIYVNGNTNDSNNFQLDGVQIDNFASGVARDSIGYYGGITIPNPDAIQEFKVLTSTYDASYASGIPGAM